MTTIDEQITTWRRHLTGDGALRDDDIDELESHLRAQVDELRQGGLDDDEAFLVAVSRLGRIDALTREFAHEHRGRLWKQLVLTDGPPSGGGLRIALPYAAATAVTVHVARLLAGAPDAEPAWLFRNAGLWVLPWLAAYFLHRRAASRRTWMTTAGVVAATAVIVNTYPFDDGGFTQPLVALHLLVVLWFVVGVAYAGGDVRSRAVRMDFVRFTGEWVIYLALIALGGGVLLALTMLIFAPISEPLAETVALWVLPAGVAGALVVAAWLVEAKQRVVENMAPVLTAVFTPLFAIMLAGAAIVYAATGLGGTFDRELLAAFDALLLVVLGLVLYGMSAREPADSPGWIDGLQLVAIVAALALDVMVLTTMLMRVGELGFTPNRVAALGLNLILLVNLAGAAWRAVAFLRGRISIAALERWQTAYLPVFGAWATLVVIALPPLFGFS